MKALFLLLPLTLLATCDDVNRTTAKVIGDGVAAQTSAFQKATDARDWRSIANATVIDCTAEPEACGKLHGMRANACLILAMDQRTNPRAACPAPTAEVTEWLDCADREYAAAAPMLAADKRGGAAANRANALYCKAESKTVVGGQAEAMGAEQTGTQAGDAIGLLWAARGAVFQARAGAGTPATRCDALRRAQALATRGAALGNPTIAAAYTGVRGDIGALRPSIPGCTL